jgi:hypothetical protein
MRATPHGRLPKKFAEEATDLRSCELSRRLSLFDLEVSWLICAIGFGHRRIVFIYGSGSVD